MKVLLIQVDVTELTEEQCEAQVGELVMSIYPEAELLSSKIASVDEETGEVIDQEGDIDEPIKH